MKFKSILSIFLVFVAVLGFTGLAHADSLGVMPVLFDSSGHAVNTSGGTLQRGSYFLQVGGVEPVFYYGDGTYFDSLTGLFGGSVFNPSGGAGTYVIPGSTEVVGIPNTGQGGGAPALWALLGISALTVLAGASYATRRYVSAR